MSRVLITGINGYIARYLIQAKPGNCEVHGSYRTPEKVSGERIPAIPLNLHENIIPQLEGFNTDIVIHAAAVSGLGACQRNPDQAARANSEATAELAQWCRNHGARLVYLSTDIIFRGDVPPYRENSKPDPVNVYGETKLKGEQAVQEIAGDQAIIRIALALGQGLGENKNFIDWFLDRLRNNHEIPLFKDEIRTPTYTGALAGWIWKIALSTEQGLFHLAGDQRIDRYTLGRMLCKKLRCPSDLLKPVSLDDMDDYPRPVDASLISTRKINGEPVRIKGIENFLDKLIE